MTDIGDRKLKDRLARVGEPIKPGRGPLRFTFDGRAVMLGNFLICTATSGNLARRISNALNKYIPNEKGY